MEEDLSMLGLTKQQSDVYLKLLQLGPSPVGSIVKSLSIARISCYDTLNRLISKGLVSFVRTQPSRLYEAASPHRLIELAEEKKRKANLQYDNVKQLLPTLLKQESMSRDKKEATIYKTKQGMKSLFNLMLVVKEPILTISATGKALHEMKFYFPHWHKRRIKERIRIKNILNEELRGNEIVNMKLCQNKYLSKEYSSPSTVFIFGDYVANMLWSDVPYAFLMRSEQIAKSYKNYFSMMWKMAKK